MLKGSLNHVSITVRDLEQAMDFFGPLLEFLDFEVGSIQANRPARSRLTVNLHPSGLAFNVWEAQPEHAGHDFEVYEPGLHHVAFNVASHDQVDAVCNLVRSLGGEILDGPGEFPFGPGGYYAVYARGPDRLKLEFVHMPELERLYRERGLLGS